MGDFQFSIFNPQLTKPLSRLFGEVFGFHAPPEYYQKKYDTSYLGVKHLCAVAMEGDVAVGFHGCIPLKFVLDGKEYLAAQTCDYLTLASHRGKGINKKLGEISYRLMREAGVQFLFTLNSDVTFAVHGALGWLAPESMHRYHFYTGIPPISKAAKKIMGTAGPYQSWVKGVFKKHLLPERSFSNPQNEEGWLSPLYTPEYFEYKTFTNNYIIDVHGTPVWVKIDGVMQIGAMGAFEEKDFHKIINTLKGLALRAGAGEILFQAAPGTALDLALVQLAPPLPSWKVGFFDLREPGEATSVVKLSDKLKVNFGDLDTF